MRLAFVIPSAHSSARPLTILSTKTFDWMRAVSSCDFKAAIHSSLRDDSRHKLCADAVDFSDCFFRQRSVFAFNE